MRIEEIHLNTWSDFKQELDSGKLKRTAHNSLLFRGQSSAEWGLETTLERIWTRTRKQNTLLNYYDLATAVLPSISSLSEIRWDSLPTRHQFEKILASTRGGMDLFEISNQSLAVWEYFAFLRHYGFPSPLLDWTRSPYVAAYFAFDMCNEDNERVAIFSLMPDNPRKTGNAYIYPVSQYLTTAKRHHLQQGEYTLAIKIGTNAIKIQPHDEELMEDFSSENGVNYKVTLPASERLNALMDLDAMNINNYSLFGTMDSLLRDAARRAMLFGHHT